MWLIFPGSVLLEEKPTERAGSVLWYIPVFSAIKKLREEDSEFQASLCCLIRPCVKNKQVGAAEIAQ